MRLTLSISQAASARRSSPLRAHMLMTCSRQPSETRMSLLLAFSGSCTHSPNPLAGSVLWQALCYSHTALQGRFRQSSPLAGTHDMHVSLGSLQAKQAALPPHQAAGVSVKRAQCSGQEVAAWAQQGLTCWARMLMSSS